MFGVAELLKCLANLVPTSPIIAIKLLKSKGVGVKAASKAYRQHLHSDAQPSRFRTTKLIGLLNLELTQVCNFTFPFDAITLLISMQNYTYLPTKTKNCYSFTKSLVLAIGGISGRKLWSLSLPERL